MRSNGRAFKPFHQSLITFPYSLAETKISTGAVLELGADVVSDMSGLAVASQMNLYRCDH